MNHFHGLGVGVFDKLQQGPVLLRAVGRRLWKPLNVAQERQALVNVPGIISATQVDLFECDIGLGCSVQLLVLVRLQVGGIGRGKLIEQEPNMSLRLQENKLLESNQIIPAP